MNCVLLCCPASVHVCWFGKSLEWCKAILAHLRLCPVCMSLCTPANKTSQCHDHRLPSPASRTSTCYARLLQAPTALPEHQTAHPALTPHSHRCRSNHPQNPRRLRNLPSFCHLHASTTRTLICEAEITSAMLGCRHHHHSQQPSSYLPLLPPPLLEYRPETHGSGATPIM